MKFLVDAHLPPRLCEILRKQGHDAIHTLDLPGKNATEDRIINQISFDTQSVVISKDTDFYYSHLLQSRPWKLLLVRTGNVSTRVCARYSSAICQPLKPHYNPIPWWKWIVRR